MNQLPDSCEPRPHPELVLHFAFPDGVLDYDCTACPAACCRGQGIGGMESREVPGLLAAYPELALCAVARTGESFSFSTPAGRCFFLEADRKCRIEKEKGAQAKPGVCLAFPFNRFMRLGKVVLVSPHFLCPLRLAFPPEPGRVAGTHAALEIELRETGLVRECEEVRSPAGSAEDVLAEEREFLVACAKGLADARFRDTLSQFASESDRNEGIRQACGLLGVPEGVAIHGSMDLLDRRFHVLAPSLRVSMLSLPASARLTALAIVEDLVRRVVEQQVPDRKPSLQATYSLAESFGPTVRLIAWPGGLLPELREEDRRLVIPAFRNPQHDLAAGIAVKLLRDGRPPAQALQLAMPREFLVADRAAFLAQMGRLLRI